MVVEFGDTIDPAINTRVHALARQLKEETIVGITEMVPTYRSLMVLYDPMQISFCCLQKRLKSSLKRLKFGHAATSRTLLVPCCYDGQDLQEVAKLHQIDEAEVIRLHSSVDYPVYMLGFLPGFVYLGGLDEHLHTPRLDSPRKVIPAGSVGIGGSQTGIYPMASPGGWRLIGRTPLVMYDPNREPPILAEAGDVIRFVPILPEEFEAIHLEVIAGTWRPQYLNRGEEA